MRSGRSAIVTLTDSVTGYRKDYWLGPYGSPQSRELYHRVLANGNRADEEKGTRRRRLSRLAFEGDVNGDRRDDPAIRQGLDR